MTFEVIDNCLSDYHFKSITNTVLSPDFNWCFNDHVVKEGTGDFQFTHNAFSCKGLAPHSDREMWSPCYPLFRSVLEKLKASIVYKVKINLRPRTFFHRKSDYHVDGQGPARRTAIYYVNTNNGWTRFKKGGKVKSVANRMVIFDSDLEHSGVSCTDEQRRVVVNFNYD